MTLNAPPAARAAVILLAGTQALFGCAPETGHHTEISERAARYAEDFDYLKTTLNERHPDMYHERSPEAFDDDLQAILSQVDSLSDFQVMMELRFAIASLGDAHTSVAFYDEIDPRGWLPIETAWFERSEERTADWRSDARSSQQNGLVPSRHGTGPGGEAGSEADAAPTRLAHHYKLRAVEDAAALMDHLAHHRAEAVADALAARGVARGRLWVSYRGNLTGRNATELEPYGEIVIWEEVDKMEVLDSAKLARRRAREREAAEEKEEWVQITPVVLSLLKTLSQHAHTAEKAADAGGKPAEGSKGRGIPSRAAPLLEGSDASTTRETEGGSASEGSGGEGNPDSGGGGGESSDGVSQGGEGGGSGRGGEGSEGCVEKKKDGLLSPRQQRLLAVSTLRARLDLLAGKLPTPTDTRELTSLAHAIASTPVLGFINGLPEAAGWAAGLSTGVLAPMEKVAPARRLTKREMNSKSRYYLNDADGRWRYEQTAVHLTELSSARGGRELPPMVLL